MKLVHNSGKPLHERISSLCGFVVNASSITLKLAQSLLYTQHGGEFFQSATKGLRKLLPFDVAALVVAGSRRSDGPTEIWIEQRVDDKSVCEHKVLQQRVDGEFRLIGGQLIVVSRRTKESDVSFIERIAGVDTRALKSGLLVPLPDHEGAKAVFFLGSFSNKLLQIRKTVSLAEIYAVLTPDAQNASSLKSEAADLRQPNASQQEAYYRQILDGIDLPAAILDDDLTFLWVNPSFEETLGYMRQHVEKQRSLRDLISPSERRQIFRDRENRTTLCCEAKLVLRNGAEKSFEVSLRRQTNPPLRIATFRDVSTLHESAAELRERAERLAVIQAVGEVVNAAMSVEEIFVRVVKKLRHVAQFEYAGLAFHNAVSDAVCLEAVFKDGKFSPGKEQISLQKFVQLVGSPRGILENLPDGLASFLGVKKAESVAALVLSGRTKDGGGRKQPDHEAAAVGCLVLASGYPRAFSHFHKQVLESISHLLSTGIRKVQLFQKVSETKNYLESVLKSSADAIVTSDRTGRVTYFSPGAEQMLGLSAGVALGRKITEFIHDAGAARQLFKQTMREKKVQSYECEVVHADGGRIPASLSLSQISDDGGRITGFLAIGKDISARKQAERENRRRGEELENYIYLISHNLKTPIVSIQGFVNLLLEEIGSSLSQQNAHFLERIQKNAALMEKMIVDLFDFSRMSRLQPALGITRIQEIVNSVVDEMRLFEHMRDVEFDIAQDLPEVIADVEGMQIVFENLISNAAKYRRPGMPAKIKVGWESHPRFYAFYVQDNGIGFDPAFKEKAFSLFQRGPNTGQIPGTGVGLALVKRIVENHQGLVRIESTPSGGSTIHFTLPKESTRES